MRAIRTHKSGFTLVEILIVVIILGILAAIVIPQFTNASEDARKSSLTSQLQTLRSQVELYKLQHRDSYPTGAASAAGSSALTTSSTFTAFWAKMATKTDEDGVVDATGEFGPYLQSEPKNNLNGLSALGTAPAAGVGFVLDANGKIFATGKNPSAWFDEATGDDTSTAPAGYTAIN